MNLFENYARFSENPNCVQQVYNSEFSEVEKEVEDFSVMLTMGVFFFLF